MHSSIRLRLTAWYVSIFGGLLIIFTVNLYSLLSNDLSRSFDQSLMRSAQATANYFSEFAEKNNVEGGARETVRDSQFGELRSAILREGKLLAVSEPGVAAAIANNGLMNANRDCVSFSTDKSRNARLASIPLLVAGTRYSVVVLEPFTELDDQLSRMRRVFILGIPFALVLGACGGFVMAGKSLEPMVLISNQAAQISAESLGSRLAVRHPSDEVGRLATVINALLARLESSFRVMRDFMADASHELRTPLAIIQGEADVALSQERSSDEYCESLKVIRGQSQRVGRIVTDMLALARADAGQKSIRFEEIYLNDLVEECCRAAQTLAAGAHIQLACKTGDDIPFHGDPELLKRMILNLIDNAIHYTPAEGRVRVTLETTSGSARLAVSDTGPGIPDKLRNRVFDRFYRGSHSAGNSNGGSGLGLSIVKLAAELHQGTVALASEPGAGSTFTVTLPLA